MNAGAFVGVEILHREPPVVHAASDHNGSRADALAAGKFQNERRAAIVRRFETDHVVGNGGLDPELVGLVIGARHQRHAADAGRKAEIILDARRRAGLAAERTAVQRQHRKSFRGRVDRRGEARRSRTDDSDIIKPVRIDRADQADATRKLDFARVAQHLPARAYHDRQLPGIDVKALDQCLSLRIGVGIDHHARRAVARQEAFEPYDIGIFGAADDHRSADTVLKHLRPAQDQRAHHPFAELGFGDHQGTYAVGRKDQRLDRSAGHGVAERWPAGKLRQFAKQRARAERVKVLALAVSFVAVYVHLAAENDAEPGTDFANLGQRLAGGKAAYLSEAAGALDVVRIKMRQDLVAAGLEHRGGGITHLGTFLNSARVS